jgi:hypothetical protein
MKSIVVAALLVVVPLGWLALRREPPPEMSPLIRRALRIDALGCYGLLTSHGGSVDTTYYNASPVVRLDGVASAKTLATDPGTWQVIPFDTRGRPSRTTRGMLPPSWTADSLSDTVRISFVNGFSGAEFAFALPRSGRDTLHGRATEFWDFAPSTDRGRAHAVRVPCPQIDTSARAG